MSKKMLIDAAHPEETRVVVVEHSRIEELDFESQNKRQLRGNVYLARVTRVEPSLQAAFVEYGGNRHGFLAFSEIHPDYYQIPYEDRMSLLEAEEAINQEEDEEEEAEESSSEEAGNSETSTEDPDADNSEDEADEVAEEQAKTASRRRQRANHRRYKIQEVIKRGQILLIQVVKEERGNKGAAMTTYLSLAGRYCVFMPNTPRGGGISRKISNSADRKRLKKIVSDLDVPKGIGVIVRTAGAKRTKSEIKRDYDYLSRLWETIRETTLKSIAPALIYEEGNLVKRSIRDLYSKEIDEVLVQGDEAYKTAKAFIKMLMPSHARNVKAYKDDIPLFLRYHVEQQLEQSLESVVQLSSGGYLVIHPTEALVSVDVNSGRSTRERNVERTALKTNLEAADEVARQMRLRDLAGLVVIDFIDMDDNRNNRAVEKRMKEALSKDRARVHAGRISQFGLMEISRQRRRRSLLEGSTVHCEHCSGVGRRRSIESSALHALRAIEEVGVRGKARHIRLKVAPDVALYIINEKRERIQRIDDKFSIFTELVTDTTLLRPEFEIEIVEEASEGKADPLDAIKKEQDAEARSAANESKNKRRRRKKSDAQDDDSETESDDDTDHDDAETNSEDTDKKRRRRRGRRGSRGRTSENSGSSTSKSSAKSDEPDALRVITPEGESDNKTDSPETPSDQKSGEASDTGKRPKRDSSRSRKAPARKPVEAEAEEAKSDSDSVSEAQTSETAEKPTDDKTSGDVQPKPTASRRRAAPASGASRRRKAPSRNTNADTASQTDETTDVEANTSDNTTKPKRKPRKKAAPKEPASEKHESTSEDVTETADPNSDKASAKKSRTKAVSKTTTNEKAKSQTSRRRKAPSRSKQTASESTSSSDKSSDDKADPEPATASALKSHKSSPSLSVDSVPDDQAFASKSDRSKSDNAKSDNAKSDNKTSDGKKSGRSRSWLRRLIKD